MASSLTGLLAAFTGLTEILSGGPSCRPDPGPAFVPGLLPAEIRTHEKQLDWVKTGVFAGELKSDRERLTRELRARLKQPLNWNGQNGYSHARAVCPKDRCQPCVLTFEIEGSRNQNQGVHQCEALGRGGTLINPTPQELEEAQKKTGEAWIQGQMKDSDGKPGPACYFVPSHLSGGATMPGVFRLSLYDPKVYEITLRDRTRVHPERPYYGSPLFAAQNQAAARPNRFQDGNPRQWFPPGFLETGKTLKNGRPIQYVTPEGTPNEFTAIKMEYVENDATIQTANYPLDEMMRPYGRWDFAVHIDAYDDPELAKSDAARSQPEFQDFAYRKSEGCMKLRADCEILLDEWIAEQREAENTPLLEVREQESVPWQR